MSQGLGSDDARQRMSSIASLGKTGSPQAVPMLLPLLSHSDVETRVRAVDALASAGIEPERIGGLTMGADPIAYAVAGKSFRRGHPIHAFSVRKEAKGHGRGRRIEGCFEPGARVVVVEDVVVVLSGGGSVVVGATITICEAGSVVNTRPSSVPFSSGGPVSSSSLRACSSTVSTT